MTEKCTDMEKMKRRMIRAIGRLTQDKKPEAELWDYMAKEYGASSKVLWERMRFLTLKKLKILLEAEDVAKNVPRVARMTLTDWLIFDLVLVHENIDVIDRDKLSDENYESKVLTNLFSLVQKFEIEGRVQDDLADAWISATVHYNSLGHQCSPMLLQRRWYQLKELTRASFYKFWFIYRGNKKRLDNAKEETNIPSIFRKIAVRYSKFITSPFIEWEECIQKGLIIMPEEFEKKMRSSKFRKPSDLTVPDIIMVEPQIKTIDLCESEEESETPKEPEQTDLLLSSSIKTEPLDEEHTTEYITPREKVNQQLEDEIERLENELIDDDDVIIEEDEPSDVNTPEPNSETTTQTTTIEEPTTNVVQQIGTNVTDVEDIIIEKYVDSEHINDQENHIENINEENDVNDEICDVETAPDLIIKVEQTDLVDTENIMPIISTVESVAPVANDQNTPESTQIQTDENIQASSSQIVKVTELTDKKPGINEFDSMMNIDLTDNGIELVDDGIEYIEDDDGDNEDGDDEDEDDEMGEELCKDTEPKFDLKLLMYPVVYTTKLDNLSVYKDRSVYSPINEKQILEQITEENKPLKLNIKLENCDEEDQTQQDSETSDEENDTQRIKLSSYLLNKPKTRTYNPIKLCKNPDFNTRLKRLPVGFYGSVRNLELLRACKPMTIDLSKAFESKLVNGTVYLKTDDVVVPLNENNDVNVTDVMPLATPVQSLMDIDKILEEELKKRIAQRNRAINLPDISQVRRINQHLLTAEVTPLRQTDSVNSEVKDAGASQDEVAEVKEQGGPPVVTNSEQGISEIALECNEPMPTLTETNVNINKNTERRKQRRTFWPPASWIKKAIVPENSYTDDRLLPIDTVYKIMFALDPNWIKNTNFRKYNPPDMNKKLMKQYDRDSEVQEKTDTDNRETQTNIEMNDVTDGNKESVSAQDSNKPPPKTRRRRIPKPKINVIRNKGELETPKQKRYICCWSKRAMDKILGKLKPGSERRHTCLFVGTGECVCCCKQKLKDLMLEMGISTTPTKPAGYGEELENQDLSEQQSNAPKLPEVKLVIHDKIPKSQNKSDDIGEINKSTDVDNSFVEYVPAAKPPPEPKKYVIVNPETIRRQTSRRKVCWYHSPTNSNVPIRASWTVCTCGEDNPKQTKAIMIRGTEHFANIKQVTELKSFLDLYRHSRKDRPIFVGKNKLLLTNIKFGCEPPQETPPILPLPKGVQIILLPDGTLTATIMPGVEVPPEDLQKLPTIMAAIQTQLNKDKLLTQQKVPQVEEIIDLDQDDTQTQENENSSLICNESFVSESETILNETNTTFTTLSTANVLNDGEHFEASKQNNPTIETDESSSVHKDTIINTNTLDSAPTTINRTSLLSDLMEMSGINEEDTAPAAEPQVQIEMPIIPLELPRLPTPPTDQLERVPNLSTINSFEELKYAHIHNGKFYKLDLDTGVISNISLVITKKAKMSTAKPKSVIDLTDEPEKEEDTSPIQSSAKTFKFAGNTYRKRIGRPNILKSLLKVNSKKVENQIESKIDLMDSDNPMEEEYLLDSSDSDDEPLAKKVKRRDETKLKEARAAMNEGMSNNDKIVENTSAAGTGQIPFVPEPVPTQLVLTGDAINQVVPVETAFPNDNDDDDDEESQQDCILGV